VGQSGEHRWPFVIYFLFAAICAFAISQWGLLATLITVGLSLSGVLLWRRRRPQDFVIKDYRPRVLVSLMYAVVFFSAYLIVRRTQPTNYRGYNLLALAVLSILLAVYFSSTGRKRVPH
jgi:hypothetical protein